MNKKLPEHEKLIRDLYDIRAERDRMKISAVWDQLSNKDKNKLLELTKKGKK